MNTHLTACLLAFGLATFLATAQETLINTAKPQPATRGPLNAQDAQLRQRAQARRQELLDRAKARAQAQKIIQPGGFEARHPQLLQRYDQNKNNRLDSWELDAYIADFEKAREAKATQDVGKDATSTETAP